MKIMKEKIINIISIERKIRINEIYENSDEGYIEKLYQINNLFDDNIGKIYINDSTDFSIFPTNKESIN